MDQSQPETSALTTEFGPFNFLVSVVTRRLLSTSVYVRSVLLDVSICTDPEAIFAGFEIMRDK